MMPRLAIARDAFADTFRHGRLALLQFIANPFLVALYAAWLLIPVASYFHLLLNLIVALVLLVAVLALHSGTLNYFSDHEPGTRTSLWEPLRRALRHILPVALCALVFLLLWLFVNQLESYESDFPPFVRSILPLFLRRHIALAALQDLFAAAIFFLRWIVAPGLLLPFVLQTADSGFRGLGKQGFRAWRKTVFSLTYWVVLLIAALLGVLATEKIMAATPDFKTSSMHGETASLAVRLAIAYLLGLFSWLFVCSVLGHYAFAARAAEDLAGNPTA